MDKARIATIGAELKQYGDETQLGFPLSTIKVGELAELISENAGYAKEISEFNTEANRLVALNRVLIKERDAALTEIQELHQKTYDDLAAAKAEVERLSKMVAHGVLEFKAHLEAKIEHLQKELDDTVSDTGELHGKIRHLQAQFDRLAEHRAKAESDLRMVEQERDAALTEVERLKKTLGEIGYGNVDELKKRYDWI